MNRRDALKVFAVAPVAGALDWSGPSVERATKFVAALHAEEPTVDAAPYAPKFFNAHEWKTVLVLSDIIIPKDERSGSATDAKAPEAHVAWARKSSEAMRPFANGGVYVNYLGDEGEERIRAAYGAEKHARLVALKRQYDPANLFRLNQNINPGTGTPR